MKVAVISDIHENFHNLAVFFQKIEGLEIEKIICLGDLINGGIAKILAKSKVPVFSLWGNNDGDKVAITKTSLAKESNLEMSFETFDIVKLGERKIFLTHYPLLAKPMAKSGDFDAVFYGHNHQKNIEKIGECLVVNPGEISAHKTGMSTFAVYDTKKNSAEIITLEEIISVSTNVSNSYREKLGFEFGKNKTHQY
jgi:putative phosphoesterase